MALYTKYWCLSIGDFCQKCGKIARNRNKSDRKVWKYLKNNQNQEIVVCYSTIGDFGYLS